MPKDHENERLDDQQVADIRSQCNDLVTKGRVTKSQLSREASLSTSVISQFLKGVYTGRNDSVADKLRIWLETFHRRAEAEDQLLPGPGFVFTSTAERVMEAITYAHHANDIVLIHGGAGIGKTRTMREYADNHSGVCMATMTPAHVTVSMVMREIGLCYGVRRRNDTAELFSNIVKVLRERRGLLLVDEAQHLSYKALDVIRQIHDAAGCGVVLAGNDAVFTGLTATRNAEYLDRLASRVGMRVSVKATTVLDAAKLLDAWKIKNKDVRELLQQVARKPGGLRQMDKVIRCAHMYADDERVRNAADLTADDIKHAWEHLGGGER